MNTADCLVAWSSAGGPRGQPGSLLGGTLVLTSQKDLHSMGGAGWQAQDPEGRTE